MRKGCLALAAAVLLTSACGDSENTTEPLTPAKLTVVGAGTVTVPENLPVPELLTVRLTTASGVPVSRRVVKFTSSAGALVSSDSSFTDENGEASVGVTPGAAGTYTVTASSPGVESVTMTVTARAPIPVILLRGSGNNAAGFPNEPVSLSAYIGDQSGVPAIGIPVTFTVTSGGGGVSPSVVNTDQHGVAATSFTLGGFGSGTQTVVASSPGLAPVTFTVTFANPCTAARQVAVPFSLNRILDTGDCQLADLRYVEYFDYAHSTTFRLTQTSSAFTPRLVVLKGADTVALRDPVTGTTAATKLFLTAGTTRIGATSALPSMVGAYTLATAAGADVAACEPTFIMKGAASGAQAIAATDCQLTFSDTAGRAPALHYGDAYFIYLKAGQTFSVVMASGAAATATDNFIRILNPSGAEFARRDAAASGGTETTPTLTATTAGIYTIQATTFNPVATTPTTGTYTLTVN